MSANCNYSIKFYPLVEFQRQNLAPEDFKQWLRNNFKNADRIILQIEGGSWNGAPTSTVRTASEVIPDVARNAISTEGAEVSVDSLYLGHTDLKLQMEQRFAEDIVTRTVFDLFGTGKWIDFNENKNGISLGNFNIFNYKKQLLEALYKEMGESAPELRVDMSPQEYSGWINTGLAKYRNYLVTHENAGSAFTEYAILQNFDKLIKAKAPFITFNQDLQYDAIDKYQYKGPNVEHYKGFMSSEFAAIENQDSDLAKVLLSVIPEVNESGAPVAGSFIGLSGFNSAMMTLKRALLFTNTFPKELTDSYFDGVNIKLDAIIEKYIAELRKPDNKLSDDHKSFLIGKLRGIQKFIYQSNIDDEVKDMFTQMFFKTEPIQYRAYSFSDSTQGFSGSNLKESLNNAQRYQLEDSIRGAIRLIKTTDSIKKSLKDKYNIDWQNGVITISSGDNLLTLSYKYNSHGFTFIPGGSYSQEFAESAISDILSIVVPDTYMQVGLQLDGNNFNIMNDFAMPLGLVLLATYGKTDSIKWKSSRSSIVDLADYRTDLNKPARKLSVIYGSDTKNVVKSPSGNNLPLYQLTNLTYNINSLINDCKQKLGTVANAYENHLLKQHPEILVAPQVRNEVMIGGQTKEPSKLSVKELLQLSTLYDFYKPFLDDGIIYLQNATFADKSTHYLIGYDTSKVIINGNITLKDALQNVIDGKSSDLIYEFTRKERNRRISRIAGNIVSDYKQVFLTEIDAYGRKYFQNGKYGISSNWNGQFNNLNDIDSFLQNATYNGKPITIDNLKAAFDSAGIKFQDEIHAYKPRVTSRGECRINETLLNYYNIFSNTAKWQQRINESRKRFIASIKDNNWKWNRFDSGDMSKLWKDYQTKLSREWFDSNTGDMKLFIGDELHPILEAYFAADMLLSNEYNSLTIGEVWAHPNKNSNDTVTSEMVLSDPKLEEGTYEEFSEANRLIAQIKRSVAFGATYHPFAQSKLNGVSDEIEIAVVDDIKAYVSTPNGYEDNDLDAMDGSGLADTLEARFENNSLLDARVGDNKKTIMMDVDRAYGKPILLKWAVYALTNEVRRNGWNSIASAERLCKKMRSRDIGTFSQITQWYNEKTDKIIYEDHKTGRRYKILSVGLDATNNYFREVVEVGEDGQEIGNSYPESMTVVDSTVNQNTLYALDQLFGGAWTCELSENGWVYNEANNDMLEYILSKRENQEIKKRAFIAYTVNKSAIKVGAGNVNPNTVFNDDSELGTITMRTRYGGVQMDADHELDMAEVTEMTQMISSLIEDGHYPEIVKQIYSDLGRVVAKHLEKYKVPVDIINNNLTNDSEKQQALEKLHQLLGESLIESFSTSSKDTLGLAQAFLKKAAEAIKNKEEFQIPFSAATINGSFISDVVSSINRGGIRHKYEGFAGVLNPSYNMIQYYNVWNGNHFENRLYPQVAELIRRSGKDFNSTLSDRPYILDFNDKGVDIQNPFIKQINHWSELQFEDTVIINDRGTSETIYLNTFDKLDELKERMRTNPFLVVGLHTLRPRNLRGAETRFKVGNNEYSYYDLDSVRLVFYLNSLSKVIKEAKKQGVDTQTAFNSLPKYKQDFLRVHRISESTPASLFQSAIRKANSYTQKCLKHIEEGKAFNGLAGMNQVIANSWYTRPAEIIMGRYQMKKFGFTNNDHIFNVTDASFFRDKLANKYNLPNEDSLSSELYDIILYKGNKKFYVKISNNPNEIYSKFKGISNNADFTINGNSVWYEDADITTPNGKQFKTYLNDFGETFNLISVDSIGSYNELLDSGIFDQIKVMNYTDSNLDTLKQIQFENNTEAELHLDRNNYWNTTEIPIDNVTKEQLQLDWEIRKRWLISKKADDMYDSFVQSLNIVGARIPTQAMQSFMPMHIIAFTDVDTNAVYVPAAQTALQGSDYDIDKLYIMTHSIDDNGILSIGSKLQSQLGLAIVSKLGTPTNITYGYSNNGTIVTYNEMEGVLGNELISNQETIDVLKRIYNGNGFIKIDGVPITNLKKVERDKKQFLKLVNSHSQSRRDVRGNALKNRIVSAIKQITLAPQNQLVAQVPINMNEPKAAAKNSKLGKAELHINSDNPETKFMMQVQNMVGKEVIGISAVSLKAFFGLSYYYNQKVQNLKDAILNKGNQDILNALNELLFANPLTGEITSLANIDIEQVYDLQFNDRFTTEFLNIPPKLSEWVKIDEVTGQEFFDFRQCINDIAERVNRNDSALTISAIISAATDNAKELILSKINATPELVDIYTYLTAIGVPFNKIADIMVTDSLQFLTKLGENDIFDNSSSKYKVKDMINYYVGKELPKGIERAPIITYLTLKNNVGKTILENKDLLSLLQDTDRINRALNSLYKSLQRYSNLTDDELDRITQEYDFLKEAGALSDSDRNIIVEPYSLPELRNAIKFLELTKEMLEYRANSQEFDKIQKLANVFNGVDEMSAIGRTFGINQGMPTSLYKLRGAIDNLKQNVPGFNFDLFVTDDSYRAKLIQDYNPTTFNITDVISTVPHFWEMLKTMYYAEQMLKEFSIKNRTVWNLADEIELANSIRNYHMSEKEFKSLQDYVNDVLIATFLKESQFEVFIAPDVKLITSITGNKNYSLETRKLRLDSAINVAAFKNWMDTYVIPMIIKDYAGNAFVDNLRPLANVTIRKNRETELTGWRFPFNLTEADKSPTTQQLYGSILKGFNEIANQGAGLFGQTIGDLLYVYNMIVNKDSFGQNAFTKIFEDVVQNNSESVVNKYNAYISLLDESATSQLNVTVKEAQRRIVKDNPDSYLLAVPSSNLGADFVLDLQDFYNLPNGEVVSPERLNITKVEVPEYKYTLDPQAIVVEMVKQLNSRLPDSEIHLITDDELVDFKDLPQYHDIIQSRGFILNGEMYINMSRASGATLIHEFSHLVLAGLKANPEKREWYYQLVTSIKNIPNFEEFAAMYPNHIGSDLYEEVFATILESYLNNKQYLPSDYSNDEDTNNVLYALNLNNKEVILQALSYLFGLDEGIKNLQDIIDKPLEELLDRFGHNLLNSSVPITKSVILDSQKQNTVKQELFKDNKLNMKCDE